MRRKAERQKWLKVCVQSGRKLRVFSPPSSNITLTADNKVSSGEAKTECLMSVDNKATEFRGEVPKCALEQREQQ